MDSKQTFKGFRAALDSGAITCLEQTRHFLNRIEETADLNVFLEVFTEEALQRAREIDRKVAEGRAGKLAGLVLGIKDNICYKGHTCSAGSRILEGFESLFTATALQRLIDEDVIIIGRTNCDEFAMGSSNENSAYGPVKNAADTGRVPGGSSGGSAVAVQANLCHAALGTDTGGSVRQPASFCGVVGLKPTYGLVSRYGLIAYASSFDQISPLTHCLEDAASITNIMAGKDEADATSSSAIPGDYMLQLAKPVKTKPGIALLEDCLNAEGVDPLISETIKSIATKMSNDGCKVGKADFPYLDMVVPTYQILTNAEASSNLSRYGGLLYGYRSENAKDVESTLVHSRSEGFGREVKRRIMLGTYVLNAGYYEAYYDKAQRVRRLIRDHLNNILQRHDVIMLPSTPTGAFQFGKNKGNPVAMYLEDIFTVPASLAGLPAISIPAGKDSDGMPFGIQLIGKKFEEGKLLQTARFLEQLLVK